MVVKLITAELFFLKNYFKNHSPFESKKKNFIPKKKKKLEQKRKHEKKNLLN